MPILIYNIIFELRVTAVIPIFISDKGACAMGKKA